MQGEADLARAAVTAKFEARLDAAKKKIADNFESLQAWYMAHHKTLELPGRKSVDMTYGTLGRRLGNPTLKILNRSWTWAGVTQKVRAVYGSVAYFHEPKPPELDREKLRMGLDDEQLKVCGLKVEQEENFYCDLDRSKAVSL